MTSFNEVLNHLPMGISAVDANFQLQLVNQMAKQLLDLPEHLFKDGLPHFNTLIRYNAERGDYGPGDPAELTRQVMERAERRESHHFERTRPDGTVLDVRGEPLPDGGFVSMWTDVTARAKAEAQVSQRNADLEQLNAQLTQAQEQLVQSEKMASIGQLAAGVAHEINNPIGYVHSNIGTLGKYINQLFDMLATYEAAESAITDSKVAATIKTKRQALDLEFLKEDIPMLMGESREGITRVKQIVQDLKDFSHVDTHQEWQWANLHAGIESTINIVASEVKYKAEVLREFGDIPDIECLPSQLNQVFMNLLVNAAHAMGETRGTITIRTGTGTLNDASGAAQEAVWLEFADTGSGIPSEIQSKIFDPFFTTKPIGKGTGLGLSLSYGIIVKHQGTFTLDSTPGRGSTFRIVLPVHHVEAAPAP